MSQHRTEPMGAEVYGTEPAYGAEGSTVEVGSTVEDRGTTTEQVKDQVREQAQVAQDKARSVVGQARGRLSEQVDQRSTQAGKRIAETASDVRTIAEQLRDQGNQAPASLAEQVAGQADRVGDYLRDASGDRILRDVEDFARRQPMLVAAAGLALGFAASRFLKASSSRRYQSAHQDSGDSYGRASTSPYDTRTYDTATTYGTGARYETEVPPYGPSTIPATGTPVVGPYDPDPVQGEPLGDADDQRRS
jgi:hypothetical protein